MKKHLFLFLITTSIFAQTPKPKIFFRSGFEPNSELILQTEFNVTSIGRDNSYLPPNYWGNNPVISSTILDGFGIQYGYDPNSNISSRIAELVSDPVNPANTVMHFKIGEANHINNSNDYYSHGRIQAGIGMANQHMHTYCSSIRLYIPDELASLNNNAYQISEIDNWFTLMEFWNNGNWYGDPYPFRISFGLNKLNNQPLRFKLQSDDTDDTYEWKEFSNYVIPFHTWMTLRVYIIEGNASTGHVKITLTPDGGVPVDLFDAPHWTHNHSETNPDGFYAVNPFKLYTSKRIIDYVNQNGGLTHLYWDDFILCDKEGVDLQIRDTEEDLGVEPNTASEIFWNSNDIWIRHNNDEGIEHENPLFNPGHPNFVKVRVNNKSCVPSNGTNDTLKLYWGKASTLLGWPAHWDGTLFNQGVLLGNLIGQVNIPAIPAGKDIILTIPWENIPDPTLYNNISTDPWHFCLLARIESADDQMTSPEVFSTIENAQNNNNIAWKNVTVIYNAPDILEPIGATVAVENPFETTKNYSLHFVNDKKETGKAIYDEAEVTITMGETLFEAWKEGGSKMTNLRKTKFENKMIVTGDNASLDDIALKSKVLSTVNLSFNFLTKEITNKSKYVYHVIQKDSENHIMGGETYEIRKDPKSIFLAQGGGDKEIERNTSVTLCAQEITNIVNTIGMIWKVI